MLLLRVFIPFALGYFVSYLFRTVNAVIASELVRDIDLDANQLGMLTSVYFVTFAAFQLPLGVLLDRFGPRRTEAALLLFAAAGALIFSLSESPAGLIAGRALIGFGVSACLMAAFKAYVMWFPSQRLPLINGCQMAAGGLGALAATVPIDAALAVTDWRGVFAILSGLTVAVAAAIFVIVPEKHGAQIETRLRSQLSGVASVFRSSAFWRTAPMTVASQASFLSIQGLWAGPWMRDIAGLTRAEMTDHLFKIAVAMIIGFIVMGGLAERLSRRGISPMTVAVAGIGCFALTQAVIILELGEWALTAWIAFGFFGTSGILPYAALSQRFPTRLAGRLNTGLNVLVFFAAFASQWGIGTIVNLWPTSEDGAYAPVGYQTAFALMLGLQVLALAWFAVYRKERTPPE